MSASCNEVDDCNVCVWKESRFPSFFISLGILLLHGEHDINEVNKKSDFKMNRPIN